MRSCVPAFFSVFSDVRRSPPRTITVLPRTDLPHLLVKGWRATPCATAFKVAPIPSTHAQLPALSRGPAIGCVPRVTPRRPLLFRDLRLRTLPWTSPQRSSFGPAGIVSPILLLISPIELSCLPYPHSSLSDPSSLSPSDWGWDTRTKGASAHCSPLHVAVLAPQRPDPLHGVHSQTSLLCSPYSRSTRSGAPSREADRAIMKMTWMSVLRPRPAFRTLHRLRRSSPAKDPTPLEHLQ